MTVAEVRKRYLNFFATRGHAILPSAPIVPENDSTTLFTSSGMQPLVPYLLGQPHPAGNRLADAQTCFRADDIPEVGDNRHTTFFEMLGNWSLGDYFKQDQLSWVFEFLTDLEHGLGLDPQQLYVTVFAGDAESGMMPDGESIEIWQKLFSEKGIAAPFVSLGTEEEGSAIGMQGGRIFSYGATKNWWSRSGVPAKMPPGEIGGPDSEIFYDFGLPHDPAFGKECHPNCDCGRFVEIGNSVFMQFIKQNDGSLKELPKKNVDFGGGLERLAFAAIGNPDIFQIDVFDAARRVLETRSGKSYADRTLSRSFRIILDHMRAASFFIASGIRPSNTEQGYVLRRLIRRSIREADTLGIKDAVLAEVAEGYGQAYADAYPFIQKNASLIRDELEKEEAQFRKTLTHGMRELEKMGDTIDAFTLFTTYGFPIELTAEIAHERGLSIDSDAVTAKMQEHQALSRAGGAQKFAGGLADHAEQTIRYHTAHHLLLKALQNVLGTDVHQRGSNITNERLRIDFSYGQKMTPEQITEVERIVNGKITEALPVIRSVMHKKDAEKLGAEHEFGASYPEQVSVYSVGPRDATEQNPKFAEAFSIEFCGGPHVKNTQELGAHEMRFKILKEEASSAGIRRIKAVLVA
ncbi:MAG TPA: alanine--tRNA ligase [Candidatus Paceibacterota bacterium]|nr:alanine--tRNA ligase [Candidatus Paceibacterota bacterium]